MLEYDFFWQLALILTATKLLGLITRRFHMPQVVGALAAGFVLGPAMFNVIQETDFIIKCAELGVLVLMFMAGLETDLQQLKKTGGPSLVIALLGVILPLLGGFIVAWLYNRDAGPMNEVAVLQNVFIGVILTATSVSITVETLRELGKLKTETSTAILGAAIIDDVLGIIGLTIITSFTGSGDSLFSVFIRISLFFIAAIVVGYITNMVFKYLADHYGKRRRIPIYGFVLCLILAYAAEEFFGIADITGAYLAGIIISNISMAHYITEKVEVLSYMFFGPIFFASIGIKTSLSGFTADTVIFTIVLLVVAIITKVVGCGIGAKITGFNNRQSLQIGTGMISRGEVALIVADKGIAIGLMTTAMFGPIIIVVIVTTLITPILLKIVFNDHIRLRPKVMR